MPAVAATNPPVLIALLAGATRGIRVGSGGVMLPNHAPLVVAEQFALLEAAYPGRIDLGIGRAPGTDPVTSYALRHGAGGVSDEAVTPLPRVRRQRARDDGARAASGSARQRPHPRRCGPRPRRPRCPTIWLLGSSDYSARLAAEKGMPYVFAHHFSGHGTAEALELYRSRFRPSPGARRSPRDVPDRERRRSRETAEEAERLALPAAAGHARAAHRRPAGAAAAASRRPRRSSCPAAHQPAARRDAHPLGDRRRRGGPRPRWPSSRRRTAWTR